MANGFFLGGMADGALSAQKMDLAERTLAQDTGIRSRALDLTERAQVNAQEKDAVARIDKQISDTMTVVAETLKAGREAGTDIATIQKAVTPLVQSAKQLAGAAGRNPNAIDAQVQALLVSPSALDKATMEGKSEAVKSVAKTTALAEAGINPYAIENPKDRATAENALRDDYVKNSQPFITVRDFYNNMKTADNTGAGDITRVFSFMKMQDPTSAVLPGEYATAANAAGVPEALRSMYNRLVGGGVLGDTARDQIKAQAERLYQSRAVQHDKLTTQFANTAKRQGLNVNNVILDLLPVEPPAPRAALTPQPTPASTGTSFPAPPKGFNVVQ